MQFRINEGLSDTDKRHIEIPKPELKPDNSPAKLNGDTVELVADGRTIKIKPITWRSGSEWACPFCTFSENRKDVCQPCGAVRYRYGRIDAAYMTNKKGRLPTGAAEAMRDAYVSNFSS